MRFFFQQASPWYVYVHHQNAMKFHCGSLLVKMRFISDFFFFFWPVAASALD